METTLTGLSHTHDSHTIGITTTSGIHSRYCSFMRIPRRFLRDETAKKRTSSKQLSVIALLLRKQLPLSRASFLRAFFVRASASTPRFMAIDLSRASSTSPEQPMRYRSTVIPSSTITSCLTFLQTDPGHFVQYLH